MWADETITEDFEKQAPIMNGDNQVFNGEADYSTGDSNAKIAWHVEHGTASATNALRDTKSMHMRAYYARYAATNTWNGALPYLESRTAITGLKQISFYAATSGADYLLFDVQYSTDGTNWFYMKTSSNANANELSYTSSSTQYTYTIPSPSSSSSYYIKISVNSNSTHVYKTSSGGANYTFRVDDIVFTYSTGSCDVNPTVTAGSNNGSFLLNYFHSHSHHVRILNVRILCLDPFIPIHLAFLLV